jgi:hypothetical protein
MPSSPEELLRSIERTREELALTVDTIAGRLDPRTAAKRSVGRMRSSVSGVFDGGRGRRLRREESSSASFDGSSTGGRGAGVHRRDEPSRPSASSALEAAGGTAREAADSIGSAVRQAPMPAIAAAVAALVAFAAVIAARSRRRRPADKRADNRVDKIAGEVSRATRKLPDTSRRSGRARRGAGSRPS